MEKLKIQISEVEGMTIKIPTEFSGYTFNKFYDQMVLIGKAMPSSPLCPVNETPERFKMAYWDDKDECIRVVKLWKDKGRDATIDWLKEVKGWDLSGPELARISSLIAGLRAKYKEELIKDGY